MNSKRGPACRLYVLVAAGEPSAVVLRRGPTAWWHLLHWDLAALALTPGAWFRGNLYPRRCDLSSDGRLFGYFALKAAHGTPQWPGAYFAVSKAPWLEALCAWETCGTWTWGCQFATGGNLDIKACVNTEPFHGSYPHIVSAGGMSTDWVKRDLWNELKRGWQPVPPDDPLAACVPGSPTMVLRRAQPAADGRLKLGVIHQGVDFRRGGIEGVQLEYFLQDRPEDVTPLPQAAWADWDHQGRLLIATRQGALEVFDCENARLNPIWSEDLRGLSPDPQPAPAWAARW